jgi:hypothetical protein
LYVEILLGFFQAVNINLNRGYLGDRKDHQSSRQIYNFLKR